MGLSSKGRASKGERNARRLWADPSQRRIEVFVGPRSRSGDHPRANRGHRPWSQTERPLFKLLHQAEPASRRVGDLQQQTRNKSKRAVALTNTLSPSSLDLPIAKYHGPRGAFRHASNGMPSLLDPNAKIQAGRQRCADRNRSAHISCRSSCSRAPRQAPSATSGTTHQLAALNSIPLLQCIAGHACCTPHAPPKAAASP